MPQVRSPRRALLVAITVIVAASVGALGGILPAGATAPADGHLGYYRYPAIHGDTLIFVAEGDLWRVGVQGGLAQRLTSHTEQEYMPAISPDGATLAFTATYEGPAEVYTMPVTGGLPVRRTWEGRPSQVAGWSEDGDVLYTTESYSTLPSLQLVAFDPRTDEHALLPLAQAADGARTADGTVFFTRLPFQGSHTKRYQGGTAQQLWRFDRGASEAVPLTADYPGTSKAPMPWNGRVYFASDRDGTMNLWSMAPDGSDLRQHTAHDEWDVKTPALQAGRIVYQLGPDLRLYDIDSDDDRELSIRLASDLDEMRERWIDKPMEWVTAAHLAPDGERVVLVARGEVFVMPVKRGHGRRVQATRLLDVRYRSARFTPNGERLIALSDETGEVELWSLPADGIGDRRQLTGNGAVLRWDALPSPDGGKVAHHDKNQQLWILDIATGADVRIAGNDISDFRDLAWSPDSRWLAYVVGADNSNSQVWLYDTADGTHTAATTDRFNSRAPAWSPDGDFLYLISDRDLTTMVGSPWGAYQPEPFIDRPSGLYLVALRPGLRSPFRAADELATARDEAGGEATSEATSDAVTDVAVTIDLDGLATRIERVPAPAGNYSGLQTDGEALYWVDRDLSPDRNANLLALEIGNEGKDPVTLVEGIRRFELSGNQKKILVWQRDNLHVLPAEARKPGNLAEARVDIGGWTFSLDPREQWRQMFVEAWRLERDYFYDRGMHAVDWSGMVEKYLPTVSRVTTRAELADLIAAMVSELSALHIFVRAGDVPDDGRDVQPASLGARLHRDEAAGGWRIDHVYRNDPDLPDDLSPLARAGVGVTDDDVITAVDGVATLSVPHIATLLRGKAGEQVRLQVTGPGKPGGGTATIVVPISPQQENELRYDEWEYTRRLRVEERGHGRIGYVHLRAMGGNNYEEWARNFYPVFNREGLIVDVRHNRGGNIDSWILEKLMRKAWFYWAGRIGDPTWNMQYAFRGHMMSLINERTASDGEAFAEGFRRLGMGPLLGTRTWGGEIWLSANNFLVDRGIATAAETGVYGPEGEWLIEGWGVEPDILIDNLPHATFNGDDAQLDAAVDWLLRKIEEEPVLVPAMPLRPDKSHRTNQRKQ